MRTSEHRQAQLSALSALLSFYTTWTLALEAMLLAAFFGAITMLSLKEWNLPLDIVYLSVVWVGGAVLTRDLG